jgi:hypothetical protein
MGAWALRGRFLTNEKQQWPKWNCGNSLRHVPLAETHPSLQVVNWAGPGVCGDAGSGILLPKFPDVKKLSESEKSAALFVDTSGWTTGWAAPLLPRSDLLV